MTLHARDLFSLPEETARVARAAFPKGNVYMTMRDRLKLWYQDSDFAALFQSHQGRPAESPGRLALVTVMQYAEGLTDEQAAEAVRSRIDWKYALGLALTDTGFHYSILSDFRQRLIAGGAEQQLLNDMLQQFQEQKLLKARGQQRTDSTHVLAAVRALNRLARMGETLRHALNSLAVVAPEWLCRQVSADWFERYGPRFEQYRLPKSQSERQTLAQQIGADGFHLLAALYDEAALAWLRDIPAVETLRQVWVQLYWLDDGQVRLREEGNLPPAERLIISPYDVEARYCRRRQTTWTGYVVHLSERCEEDGPHLITNVETTPATTPDGQMTATIHTHLAEKGLLPREHVVDADELVNSQSQHAIELLGPVPADTSWQSTANQGFAAACFAVDWESETVTCPQGQVSQRWRLRQDRHGNDVIHVWFARQDCRACPCREPCTRSRDKPRSLKLKPRALYMALQKARAYQETGEFRERYKKRAGVEGSLSQGTRAFGLRRARYIGLAKTRLQHIITAAAINLTRAVAWLNEETRAQTRCSRFAALIPAT